MPIQQANLDKKKFSLKFSHFFLLLFIALCLWMTLQPIPVADLWWQMKSGEVILQLKQIPKTDIFSYTAEGLPWINHEWLAGIVFYLLYLVGDFPLLYAFKSIIILISYLIMIFVGARKTDENCSASPFYPPPTEGINSAALAKEVDVIEKKALSNEKKSHTNLSLACIAAIWMILISGGNLYFDIRPYLYTYILLAATLLILDFSYNRGRYYFLYLLLPITLLWVNTHGGYILEYILQVLFLGITTFQFLTRGAWDSYLKGIIPAGAGVALILKGGSVYITAGALFLVAGIWIATEYKKKIKSGAESSGINPSFSAPPPLLQARANSIIAILRHGTITFLLSLLIGLINPYGMEIFWYPFTFLGDSFYKQNLIEWIPPDLLGTNLPFLISVLIILILSAVYHKKLRATDLMVFAAFSYLSLTVVRHSVIFSIAALPITCVVLESFGDDIYRALKFRYKLFPSIFEKLRKLSTPIVLVLLLALTSISLIIFVIPNPYRIDYNRLNLELELFPVAGVEFLRLNPLPGRMYNPYEWGGYFIWKLYPHYKVFMDGRANTVYTTDQYKESLISMRGDPGWEQIMDKYNVNFIFCNKYLRETNQHYLPDRLSESPHWALIFEDDVEQIFIRNTSENRQIIEKSKRNELPLPTTAFRLNLEAIELIRKKDLKGAEKSLEKSLSINPRHIPTLMTFGYVKLMEGENRQAERIYNRILSYNNKYPRVHYNLGKMYENEGNYREAKKHYLKELEIDPNFEPARRGLNKVER